MEQLRAGWEPARETNRWAHGDGTTRLPFPAAQHDAAHQVLSAVHLWGTIKRQLLRLRPLKSRPIPRPSYAAYYTHNLNTFTLFLSEGGFFLFNTLTLQGAYREAVVAESRFSHYP